jgi:2'-5' RNA ligase
MPNRNSPTQRLFVAIDLPYEIKLQLARLCGAPGAKWVDPGNLHLTLRFVGELDGETAEAVAAALRSIDEPRFALRLVGIGRFGRHTLWAGVEANPSLARLHDRIEDALRHAGLVPDLEPFFPHVKLGRPHSRQRLKLFLEEGARFGTAQFQICRFSLMESCLTRSGAIYSHRADYALRGGEGVWGVGL